MRWESGGDPPWQHCLRLNAWKIEISVILIQTPP